MNNQFLILLATCGTGFLMGLIIDVYWNLVRRAGWRRHRLNLADFLLWLLLAVGVFALLLGLNGGEVHFYVFLGLALGLMLYRRWLSGHVGAYLKKPRK